MLSLRLSAKELKKQDQVVKETPWPHHIETFKQVSQRTTHSNNRGEPRRDTFIYIEGKAIGILRLVYCPPIFQKW